jgi:hypothetical protein
MKVYQSKQKSISGSDYGEVYPLVLAIYKEIRKKSKRKPYIRSAYFKKQKIFLDYFWEHLHHKNSHDRVRRLKLYACALDLIKNCKYEPHLLDNVNRRSVMLYRFYGKTKEGTEFSVQIMADKRSGKKYFISVFPK